MTPQWPGHLRRVGALSHLPPCPPSRSPLPRKPRVGCERGPDAAGTLRPALSCVHTTRDRSPARPRSSPRRTHWASKPKSPGLFRLRGHIAGVELVHRSLSGALPSSPRRAFPTFFLFASLGSSPSQCRPPSPSSLPLSLLATFGSPSTASKCLTCIPPQPPPARKQRNKRQQNPPAKGRPGLSKSKTGFLSCFPARLPSPLWAAQGQAHGHHLRKDVVLGPGEVRVGRGRGQGHRWVKARGWLQGGGPFGAVNWGTSRVGTNSGHPLFSPWTPTPQSASVTKAAAAQDGVLVSISQADAN